MLANKWKIPDAVVYEWFNVNKVAEFDDNDDDCDDDGYADEP